MDSQSRRDNVSIESDAVPVGDQFTPSNEDAVADLNVFRKPRAQQETVNRGALVTNHSHKTTDDNVDNYSPYLKHFPEHLRENYIDILIINTEDDYEGARNLKELIKTNVKLCQVLTPNVSLLDDVYTDHSFQQLDNAYLRSHLIFMYVTNHFCNDSFKLTQSYQSLERALKNNDKAKAVIPIYTCPKEWINYELPMMLSHHLELNDFDGMLIERMTRLLDSKSGLILDKRYCLDKERKIYFNENRDKLMAKEKHYQTLLLSVKSSECYSGSQPKEEFQSATIIQSETNDGNEDTVIRQQISQRSAPTEQTVVKNLEDVSSSPIEVDTDISEQSMSLLQNVQHMSHTSLLNINKVADGGKYCSSEVKMPAVSSRFHSQPDGNTAMPIDMLPPKFITHVQTVFSGEQSMSNSTRGKSLADLHSEQAENNESNEGPTTNCSHAPDRTEQTSSSKSSNEPAPVYHLYINDANTVFIDSLVRNLPEGNIGHDPEGASHYTSSTESQTKIHNFSARPNFCCCKKSCVLL